MSRVIHIENGTIEFDGISLDYNAITREQELMKSDFIQLSFNDTSYRILPVGSYIEHEGLRWMLLDPYTPTQKSEIEWEYKPQFQHPKMYLGKVPFINSTTDSEGEEYNALEWSYTGIAPTLLQYFCGAIDRAMSSIGYATEFSFKLLGDVKASSSVTFSSNDILSALSSAATAFECEWHIDWEQGVLFFGKIAYDKYELTVPVLKVGDNVNIPSTNASKDGYYNIFIPQGSTRNMTRRVASGENVATNMRLTLDKDEYPEGWIDTRTGDEPMLIKSLIFDDIYPHLDLYAYNVRSRTRYLLDGDGNKVISHYKEDGTPVYKIYSIWYMRLAYPTRDTAGNITKWTDYTVLDSIDKLTRELAEQRESVAATMRDIVAMKDTRTYSWNGLTWFSPSSILGTLPIWDGISALLGREIGSTDIYDLTPEESGKIRTSLPSEWQEMCLVGYANNMYKEWRDLWEFYADQSGKEASVLERIEQIESGEGTAVVVDGMTLTCSFKPNMLTDEQGHLTALSSSLAGREFQLNFVETDEEARALSAEPDEEKHDSGVTVRKGDFEIIYETENEIIIPTTPDEGLIPRGLDVTDLNTLENLNDGMKGNLVVLFNVAMTGKYVKAAQEELKNAAKAEIEDLRNNKDNYTVKSNPVAFEKDDPQLYIGRKVIYDDGNGYTLETRVQKIVTQLDFTFEQEITVGNEVRKGTQTQLKEDVKTIISGNFQGAGMSENQVRNFIDNYVAPRYVSSQDDDTANGLITFMRGLVSKTRSLFERGIQTGKDFVSGTRNSGAQVDEYGNGELESLVIRTLIQSPTFISGFGGEGMRIYQDDDGQWHMETDTIAVRGTLRVYELLINKIRSVGGQIMVTKANGKIKSVDLTDGEQELPEEAPGDVTPVNNVLSVNGATETIPEELPSYYELTFEDGNPFVVGDLIRCQQFTGTALKSYWVRVADVSGERVYVSTNDEGLYNGAPAVGDEVVLCGSVTDTARQAAVLISASDDADGQPIISILSGIKSRSFAGCLKTRLGYLGDITDSDLGQLQGYGLYGENVYLKGTFLLKNGNSYVSVGDSITAAVGNLEIGGRNLLLNADFSNEDYKRYYGWNYLETGVEHITENLPKGFSSGVAFTAQQFGTGIFANVGQPCFPLTGGQRYTVSFYGRLTESNAADTNFFFGLEGGTTAQVALTTEWKRYSLTFTPDNSTSDNALIFYSTVAGKYAVTGLKLEEGDKATSWQESAEDTQARIDILSNKIDLSVTKDDLETVGIHLDGDNSEIKFIANKTGFFGTDGKEYIKWGVRDGIPYLIFLDSDGIERYNLGFTGLTEIIQSSVVQKWTNISLNGALPAGTYPGNDLYKDFATEEGREPEGRKTFYLYTEAYTLDAQGNRIYAHNGVYDQRIYDSGVTDGDGKPTGSQIADGYWMTRPERTGANTVRMSIYRISNGLVAGTYILQVEKVPAMPPEQPYDVYWIEDLRNPGEMLTEFELPETDSVEDIEDETIEEEP